MKITRKRIAIASILCLAIASMSLCVSIIAPSPNIQQNYLKAQKLKGGGATIYDLDPLRYILTGVFWIGLISFLVLLIIQFFIKKDDVKYLWRKEK